MRGRSLAVRPVFDTDITIFQLGSCGGRWIVVPAYLAVAALIVGRYPAAPLGPCDLFRPSMPDSFTLRMRAHRRAPAIEETRKAPPTRRWDIVRREVGPARNVALDSRLCRRAKRRRIPFNHPSISGTSGAREEAVMQVQLNPKAGIRVGGSRRAAKAEIVAGAARCALQLRAKQHRQPG